MKHLFLAAASFALITACASTTTVDPAPEDNAPAVITDQTKTEDGTTKTSFELAMETVDELVNGKNEQAAISRLETLLGDPALSDLEKQQALFRLGSIKFDDRGYDVWGAIADFEELVETYGEDALDGTAQDMLNTARGKATSLNFAKDQAETTRTKKFELMFDLGDHQEAIDLMLATGLTPSNDYLVAMYQIGYLCDGEGFTGPAYSATEPDGTARSLQFCDFGK